MLSLLTQVNQYVQGACLKEVTCEKCHTCYQYVMIRKVRGSTMGTVVSDSAATAAAATRDGIEKLNQRLERDHDLVPCPSCKWVSENQIKAYVSQRYHHSASYYVMLTLISMMGSCVVSVLLITLATAILGNYHPAIDPMTTVMMLLNFPGLPALAFWLYLKYKSSRIKPNQHWPQGESVVPANTPAAFLPDEFDEDDVEDMLTTACTIAEEVVCEKCQLQFMIVTDEFSQPVFCPMCLWTNEDQIKRHRKLGFGFGIIAYFTGSTICQIIFNLVVVFSVMGVMKLMGSSHPLVVAMTPPMWAVFMPGTVPLLMYLYVLNARRQFQPNRHWPESIPVPETGLHPALLPSWVNERGQCIYDVYDARDLQQLTMAKATPAFTGTLAEFVER